MEVNTYGGQKVQQRPDSTPQQNLRASNAGQNIARAGAHLSNELAELDAKYKLENDTAIAKEMDVAFSRKLREVLHSPDSGYYSKRGKDAFGSYQSTQDQLDKLAEEYANMAENDEQRQAFMSVASRRVESSLDGMSRHAANERRGWLNNASQSRIDNAINDAASNYTNQDTLRVSLATAKQEMHEISQREGWDADTLKNNLSSVETKMHASVLDSLLADSPSQAMQYFRENEKNIAPAQRAKIKNIINAEAKRIQAEKRTELKGEINNYIAYVSDGNSGGTKPSAASIRSAFGEKADDVLESIQRAESFGKNVSLIKTASPQEINELLTVERQDLSDQDNYQAERREVEMLIQAVQQRQTQLERDPAEYVINSFPEVGSAYRELSSAMSANDIDAQKQAIKFYSDLVSEKQSLLGVDKPRLISNAYALNIAKQFLDTEQGGQNAAQSVQTMAELWGTQWPGVLEQMQSQKLVPGGISVVASMNNSLRQTQLAEGLKVGRKELESTLSKEDIKSVDEGVISELEDFEESMVHLDGFTSTYNEFKTATSTLAIKLVSEGMHVSEAVDAAVKATVTDRYQFVDGYRIPTQVNSTGITQGIQHLKENPDLIGLAPLESVFLENTEDAMTLYLQDLEFQPVTLKDDSGVVLVDPDGYALEGTSGEPIIYSWQELQDLGAGKAAQALQHTFDNNSLKGL